MRKITLFFAVLFATMTAFSATLYLSPNANWKTDNARYAAYFFGNGESWVSMTDSNSDGVYEVEAPAGYPNVIFCRMNPSTTANNWNNKWNQTGDLKVPTDNKVKFVVPDGVWDGAGSTCWVELDDNGPVILPETWTVAGSSTALFGSEWAPSNEANDLTKGADGVWTKFYDDVTLTAGTIEYKIVKSHVWGEAYPADNAKLNIAAAGKYDVTFTFNATTHAVNATAEAVVEGPKGKITATWSIAEGAELESFKDVKVTFAGVDSVGRKLDGTEVNDIISSTSAVKIFYSVAEDGTASAFGILPATRDGLNVTYAVAEDKGYQLVNGEFKQPGKYRIVIPQGVLTLNPRRKDANNVNLPIVKNDQEFVLNFTIKGSTEDPGQQPGTPVEVDAAMTVNPENNAKVSEIRNVVITFTDATSLTLAELGETPNLLTWAFCNQVAEYEGMGTMSQPVAPMVASVAGNKLTLAVGSQFIGGQEAIATSGNYSVTIPAGLVSFDATHINKAITLNYTVESNSNDTVVVKSVEELKSHAGKLVLFQGIEPVVVKQGWLSANYLNDGVTPLEVELYPLPARFDALGTLGENGFVVDSVVAIHAFTSIGDLASFIENGATEAQKTASYEIKDPAIVTLASMFSFYVQYEAQSMYGGASWQGMMVQAGPMSMYRAKAGDAIQLKGSYTPAVRDEEYNLQQPAFFALENATLVSENNKLHYTSIEPAYIEEFYASLGRLPKGGEIAEDAMGYYYVYSYSDYVVNPETGFYDEVLVKDSLQLMIAGPVDLSAYVGVELDRLVAGVADFDPSTGAPIFYVTELQESKLYYNNIAEMIAAGSSDYTMTSALRNPVLLTYIHYNQWSGYTIFVQDSTGAIAIKGLGVETEDGYDFPYDIKPGDMITGIEGHPNVSEGAPYMWSGAEYDIEPNFVKVADGVITPLELTMAEFCADIKALTEAMWEGGSYSPKYANFVVNVKDLNKYVDPDDEKWPWLTNGVDSIQVSTYYWGRIAVPEHIASLTGIADYGVINSNGTPTIQPLDADAVIEQFVEAKNAYAYDVRVEKTDDAVVVSYALNAPAKSVRVIAKAEGEVVATKAGSAVAQVKDGAVANVHSVEFAIAELPKKEITFEVEVTGENVAAPALVPVQYGFYHSQGIDVDVNPESEFFGRVYATECMPDGIGKAYHSTAKGQALYAFDATLAPIANNEGTYGFTGGLTTDAANKDPRKVRISEDGRVFLTRQALTGVSPLVEVNPADLNANFTDVFVDFTVDAETYELKTADGKFMASPNIAFDVKGQGEDLKVFMLSTTKAGIAYNPRGNYAKEYNLGTAKTWNAEPSATIDALDTLTHYTVNYLGASVEYDNEGGIWYCQYRGTPKETEPSLIHVNAQGVEDYKDFTFVARSSAIRFNNDFSLLAIAGNGGKKCTIFKVEKDADGKPVLNKQYEFAVNGNNVNDMAWDYANNLYLVNSSSELLYMFAMPRESAVVTTPAAARYTVSLELPMEVEFENIAAIYEMGMWDMAYYESYNQNVVKALLKSQPTVVDKVVTSGMMGGSMNNYYLNDGTGVIVLQAEGDRIEPIVDENWEQIGNDTIPGLNIEIGKKLPANFFATIDFKTVIDDETYLPTGEVYGAPVMAYVPRETGDTIVDEFGWETIVTESNEDFAARCEASDFVEEAVEVSIDDLLANRIDYAGKLVVVDTTGNYYAESMMDHFAGVEKTTAYMYCGEASESFEVESYEEEGTTYVYVYPKYTEDNNNFAGTLFNLAGGEFTAAALDANVTIDMAKARFDWNSIAQGQSMIVKEYQIVTPGDGQDVDNSELVVNIYSNNGSVYVETEAGAMIEVYTVNGLRVYAGVSNTNTTVINGLNTNIAIIRVNGEAYKVFVK